MDGNTQSNIEASNVFNTFVYLDDVVTDNPQYEGWTLDQIITDLETNGTLSDDQADCVNYLRGAINSNPEWGEAVLRDVSSTNASQNWTDDLIQGATFQLGDDYYVAFRGTGSSRWTDNAKGMTEMSTEMQRAAAAYFDSVASYYGFTDDMNVYVTGHSKGGNEAQFVFMYSRYAGLIDGCYSMDGQGFSPAAIAYFKSIWGDEYEERLKMMYSICGEDDPVHQLGTIIIPDENTYYLKTTAWGIVPWHDLKYMSGNDPWGNWYYDGLHWTRDENGNIINGEPGAGAILGGRISEQLMNMDPKIRESCATCIMNFIDGGHPLGMEYQNPDLVDWIRFFAYGMPVIAKEVFLTKEGHEAIIKGIETAIKAVYEKWGIPGILIGSVIVALLLPIALNVLRFFVVDLPIIANLVELVYHAIVAIVDAIKDIAKAVKDAVCNFINAIAKAVNDVIEFFKNLDPDVRFANDNPHFIVDTSKLRGYGDALSRINRTIASVDSRLDRLYGKVGLLDLWNLMQADILTSHNRHIEKAANFCYDTANRFETAENNINKQW